jgi:hypothetical protein
LLMASANLSRDSPTLFMVSIDLKWSVVM